MNMDIVKYNLIREALANNDTEDSDIVRIRPKTFALKKAHSAQLLAGVRELILDDDGIFNGITPLRSIERSRPDKMNKPATEGILYVLVAYAVAVQQQWIRHSTITNRYHINADHQEIVQYIEDVHKRILS